MKKNKLFTKKTAKGSVSIMLAFMMLPVYTFAGTIVDATNKTDGEHAYTITLISDSGDEYFVTFSEDGFIGMVKDKDDKLIYYGID